MDIAQHSGQSQYERLTDVLTDVRARSRRIISEAQAESRPKLVFVYGETCGRSRRAEAFLAQVLQQRRNHATFDLVRVSAESQPSFVEQLGVLELPTLVVIDGRKIAARVENPRGRREIEVALSPWLR